MPALPPPPVPVQKIRSIKPFVDFSHQNFTDNMPNQIKTPPPLIRIAFLPLDQAAKSNSAMDEIEYVLNPTNVRTGKFEQFLNDQISYANALTCQVRLHLVPPTEKDQDKEFKIDPDILSILKRSMMNVYAGAEISEHVTFDQFKYWQEAERTFGELSNTDTEQNSLKNDKSFSLNLYLHDKIRSKVPLEFKNKARFMHFDAGREILRRIFELNRDSYSLRQIAKELNSTNLDWAKQMGLKKFSFNLIHGLHTFATERLLAFRSNHDGFNLAKNQRNSKLSYLNIVVEHPKVNSDPKNAVITIKSPVKNKRRSLAQYFEVSGPLPATDNDSGAKLRINYNGLPKELMREAFVLTIKKHDNELVLHKEFTLPANQEFVEIDLFHDGPITFGVHAYAINRVKDIVHTTHSVNDNVEPEDAYYSTYGTFKFGEEIYKFSGYRWMKVKQGPGMIWKLIPLDEIEQLPPGF